MALDAAIDWDRTGNVFNIQRYSLHDGPGIRTILFFKGCGLRCRWCCNPESQDPKPQILFLKSKCIGCRSCARVCPAGAIVFEKDRRIDAAKCVRCGRCAQACMAGALERKGGPMTVREAIREMEKDEVYYSYSGGGVTLSGGEALLQPAFAAEVLKACRRNGWNTAIETALFVGRDALDAVLPYTDLFLADFKLFDSEAHRAYTGQPNDRIRENYRYLAEKGAKIVMRIPLIPTVNDSEQNLRASARFARELGSIEEVDLLPYHRLGVNKYGQLGRPYGLPDVALPGKKRMEELAGIFREMGFAVKIGG